MLGFSQGALAMFSVRRVFAIGIAVLCAVLACTAGNSSVGSATDAQSFISQLCDIYAPCCAKVNQPADGARCRAFYTGFLGNEQYDPAKGSACLSEERGQQSSPNFCSGGASAPSCKNVFRKAGTGGKQPG